jgi:hypothetical protein
MTLRLAVVLGAAGFLTPDARSRQLYELLPGSTLTRLSCLPPCTCPPVQLTGPLSGTFSLVFDHEEGGYRYYNVLGAAWVADLSGAPTPVVGSGTYRILTPIAFLHQMELTLQVGGDPPRIFDSGLVSADPHLVFPSVGVLVSTAQFDCNRDDIDIAAAPASCYANCDGSTAAPVLNVDDFLCFLNRFFAGDPYANCDGSTAAPVLNINDFPCFINRFMAGCV